MSISEFFDNSFVISIDEERLNRFYSLFLRHFKGVALPKHFYGYVNGDLKPTYKCMLSHASVVRMAKCMGLPFAVIFEDDAYPCDGIQYKLEQCLSNIPKSKIALIGWNKYKCVSKVDDVWNRLEGWVWGSHAYVIFNDAYDSYISKYNKNPLSLADQYYEWYGRDVVLPRENLFIQYSPSASMNGYTGYICDNIRHRSAPKGFSNFEEIMMRRNCSLNNGETSRKCVICGYFVNDRYNSEDLFFDWLNNVATYYLTDVERKIVVFTDNPSLSKYKCSDIEIIIAEDDFSDIGENRLKKIKYLKELCHSKYCSGDDILISFLQSNFRLNSVVTIDELLPEGFDMAVPLHPDFNHNFAALYLNHYATPNGKSLTDISNIDCENFIYYQDGHIVGKSDVFTDVIDCLWDMILEDKKRGINIIGQPFDERYFNFYINGERGRNIKVHGLECSKYNNRNRYGDGCKIYQIDKRMSSLFRGGRKNVHDTSAMHQAPSVAVASIVPESMSDNPYFMGALH